MSEPLKRLRDIDPLPECVRVLLRKINEIIDAVNELRAMAKEDQ